MAEKVTEEQPENKVVTKQVIVAERKFKAWIGLILIVLLIIVLATIGTYLLQQLNNKQENQKANIAGEIKRVSELTTQINSIQSELASTQKQLTSVNADVTGTDDIFNKRLNEFSKRQDEKLTATHADLKLTILQLQRQLGKTRGDWLMADAEYLLSVANQRLHLMGDLNTTREALKAADQRLRESGDAAAFKVREQITKELSALKEVTVNDIVGNYSSLQMLIDKIDGLALILPYAAKPLTNSKEVYSDTKNVKNSHTLMNLVLKQLEGTVSIRHTNQAVNKILTTEEAKLIKQQLSIKLEMVKIALVQKNKALYETSVDDALKWIDINFITNEKSKIFISELKKLNKVQIHSELPDISLSLKMLRDITKLRIETDKALPDETITATDNTTTDINSKNKPETPSITRSKEIEIDTSINTSVVSPKNSEKDAPATSEPKQ